MSSTIIVCPVCKHTEFTDKGRSGSLLLACKNCGTNVTVTNGGVAQVVVEEDQVDAAKKNYIYATEKPKKAKDQAFVTLSLRVPRGIHLVVRAALLAAKHVRGAHGKWFAGAVIGDIFTDYLSSVDWSEIPYATQGEIEELLRESAQLIQEYTPNVSEKDPLYGAMVSHTGMNVRRLVTDD